MRRALALVATAVTLASLSPGIARAQWRVSEDRYDDAFRKYTKRFFGPGFDWRYFKAQGLAESDLMPSARSRVGARGIMQLMPTTFNQIRSVRPEFGAIDDPEWNIAAGILHDHDLWVEWQEAKRNPKSDEDRACFMFGAYNAGEGPIMRAQATAREKQLDHRTWTSVEQVAPQIERWRYRETLDYVKRIRTNREQLQRPRDARWKSGDDK